MPATDTPATLNALAAQWLDAKASEDAARDLRLAIERNIVAMTGVREEGAETHKTDRYAIAVTGKLTRTLDLDRWRAVAAQVPEAMRPIKPAKTAIAVKLIEQKAA